MSLLPNADRNKNGGLAPYKTSENMFSETKTYEKLSGHCVCLNSDRSLTKSEGGKQVLKSNYWSGTCECERVYFSKK